MRTLRLSFLLALVALLAAALATTGARAGAPAAPSRAVFGAQAYRAGTAVSAPAPLFSHGVPTDEQRPGFEPDVVVDNHRAGTDDGLRLYSSTPFGFSTTESFLSMSRDSGETFKLTAGNIGPGKPTTCAGGGDTELQLDTNGTIFFSDLQGLTNLSNSVSTDHGATFTTNCAAVPNTPVDRMWYAHTGTLAGGNLKIYEEYDAVASSLPSTQNQLVETVSTDGLAFLPLVNTNAASDCLGFGAANCVNDNEGLPGNQIVDPASGDIFITHTAPGSASTGAPQVIVERGHVTAGPPDTVTWTHIGPINGALCPDPSCVDSGGNPEDVGAENFPVIAEDKGHTFYVAFASAPVDSSGTQTAPEQIYVSSSADGTTFTAPVQVSTGGTNTFPWIVAGSHGRVDLAWYHTDETDEGGVFGAGNLTSAEWNVQFAQSLNAGKPRPAYAVSTATEHFIKHGQICTNGLGCTTGGDRSLGDFMQIATDKHGAAIIAYVDDTSNTFSGGEAAGPSEMIRQRTGSSLFASVTSLPLHVGPGGQNTQVKDDTGDATYSANGTDTPAGDNLDLTASSITQDGARDLVVTMTLKSLASLSVSPTVGGPVGAWIVRWVQVDPTMPGNGHVYYAGMQSVNGGTPTFFDGDMSCQIATTHCKYFTYPGDRTIAGSYVAGSGVITLHVPLADIGSPAAGTTLYSAVAFTTTSLLPLSADAIFNQIDATTPFDKKLK
jgi:hypothetical protein